MCVGGGGGGGGVCVCAITHKAFYAFLVQVYLASRQIVQQHTKQV